MKPLSRRRLALAVGAAAMTLGQAQAQPGQPAALVERAVLENITVTATRIDETLDEVARSMAVVDRLTIETIQPQSIAQTLAYEPNITVAGGPRPANQTVNIRGLTGNKVLQTIDGSRQSFESGHRPSYFLDPELLRSVEAVRGPASSLWGSGALGGVVAQNTVAPEDLVRDGAGLGGFAKTGYNDNNGQSTTTLALAGDGERVDWLLSAYYRDSDDIELGNGEDLAGSASRSRGAMAKLAWDLAPGHELAFNYRRAEVDGTVPSNGSAEITGTSNFLVERDQATDNVSLGYRWEPGSDWLDVSALLYYNTVDMEEVRVSDGRPDQTELDTLGFNLANVSRWRGITLQYGVDSYRETFSADRGGSDRPAPPEAETRVWSAYARGIVPVAERWRLELGLRYDDFTTEADNLGEERSDSATSPSAALVWEASDWATLTLRHDRAFRAPSAEELYSSGTHFCLFPGFCNGFVPNPELDPEEAANTELLARLNFRDALGADHLSLHASVFENRVDDFIEQIVVGPFFFPVQDPGTTTWVNVDEATIRGFELSGRYTVGNFSAQLAYGQTRGEDDDSGSDLTNIPADTLKGELSYHFTGLALVTGLRVTHADDQDRTDYPENSFGTTYDGYTVSDLYASWQPRALDGVKLDLTLNNLEDSYYRRAWDQLPEAGRSLILSARYSF